MRDRARGDRLSRDRIIDTAIDILDTGGEKGLTFLALAKRLQTGSGAIYWHVADKSALLAAAADRIVAPALATSLEITPPRETIRTAAMSIFDAIDAHPWLAGQIARDPQQAAALSIFERFGGALQHFEADEDRLFDAWSALVNYVLGAAVQNAENGRQPARASRMETLGEVADRWLALDRDAFPFLRRMAAGLPDHDDRAQFLAGVDLILDGVASREAAQGR